MALLLGMGWSGSLYLLQQERTFNRWFLVLIMSVWFYISIVVVVVSFNPPITVWLCLGGLPLAIIAYGYRLYDYRVKMAESPETDEADNETQTDMKESSLGE